MRTKEPSLSRSTELTSSSSHRDSSMSSSNAVVVSVPVPICPSKRKSKTNMHTNLVSSNDSGFSFSPSSPKWIDHSSSISNFYSSPSSIHPTARSWHSSSTSSASTNTTSFSSFSFDTMKSSTSHSFSSGKSMAVVKKPKKHVQFNFSKMTYRFLPKDSASYWKKVEKQFKTHHLTHPIQLAFADYFITDHHGHPVVHVGPFGPWSPHQAVSPRPRLNSMPTLAFSKLSLKKKEDASISSKKQNLNLVELKSSHIIQGDDQEQEKKKQKQKQKQKEKGKEKAKKNSKEKAVEENLGELELQPLEKEREREKERDKYSEDDGLIFPMDESINGPNDHCSNGTKHELKPMENNSEMKCKTPFLKAELKEVQVSSQLLKQAFLDRQPSHSILHLPSPHVSFSTSNHDSTSFSHFYFVDLKRLKKMIESDPETPSATWQTIDSTSTNSSCSSSSTFSTATSTDPSFSHLKKRVSTHATDNTAYYPDSNPYAFKSEPQKFYKPHTNAISLHF